MFYSTPTPLTYNQARSAGTSLRLLHNTSALTQQADVRRRHIHSFPIRCSKEKSFFDRVRECEQFIKYLSTEPAAILVIVGPRSSGKTALLQEICSRLSRDQQTYPPSYLDGRAQQLSGPGDFKKALQVRGNSVLAKIKDGVVKLANSPPAQIIAAITGREQVAGTGISISGEKIVSAFFNQQDQTINDVIAAYNSLLAWYKSAKVPEGSWPMLCIDEANVLTEWQEGSREDRKALKSLLNFFLRASKTEQSAHIVLATSEYSFISWLAEEIGYNAMRVEVIGDFPEEEARQFADYTLARAGESTPLSDDDWQSIYEVCGGNAGQLRIAVLSYSGDWTDALEKVWFPLDLQVQAGFSTEYTWRPDQYEMVLRSLLSAKYNAVPLQVISQKLGVDGKKIVKAMVKENLLSFRPQSGWARDLPRAAHLHYGKPEAVITAPTPGHLYCIKLLIQSMDEEAKAEEKLGEEKLLPATKSTRRRRQGTKLAMTKPVKSKAATAKAPAAKKKAAAQPKSVETTPSGE